MMEVAAQGTDSAAAVDQAKGSEEAQPNEDARADAQPTQAAADGGKKDDREELLASVTKLRAERRELRAKVDTFNEDLKGKNARLVELEDKAVSLERQLKLRDVEDSVMASREFKSADDKERYKSLVGKLDTADPSYFDNAGKLLELSTVDKTATFEKKSSEFEARGTPEPSKSTGKFSPYKWLKSLEQG